MLTYSHEDNIHIIFLCKGEIFIPKSNINTLFEIKQAQLQRQQILSGAFTNVPCNSLIKEARQLSKLNALSDTLTQYDSSLKKLTERSCAIEHPHPYLPSALSDFSKQYNKLNDLSKPFAASLEQAHLFSKQNITGISKALDLTQPAINSISSTTLHNLYALTNVLTPRLDHINKLTEAPRLYGVANAWLASKPKLDSLFEKMDFNHLSDLLEASFTLSNSETSNDEITTVHDMYHRGEITNDDISEAVSTISCNQNASCSVVEKPSILLKVAVFIFTIIAGNFLSHISTTIAEATDFYDPIDEFIMQVFEE